MKELGSSSEMTDGKHVQDRRAKEAHKTRGDATTEQTSPESKSIISKIPHFIGNAAYYTGKAALWTSAVTALGRGLSVGPTLVEGLSHNNQYELNMRDDRGAQPSQRGISHYSLESRHGSSSFDSPSGDMGKGHDEFPLMVRIGDYEFVKPTADTIKALLQDKEFPKHLRVMCKNTRDFTYLLKNKIFLDMVSDMYQDENVLNFMHSLCKDPGFQADFLKLKKEVSNSLIEKRIDALFKRMGARFKHMDAIPNRFGNDDGYDRKREIDHFPIQKKQQYQEQETVITQMMYKMYEMMSGMMQIMTRKTLDHQYEKVETRHDIYKMQHEKDKMQHEKDKIQMSQDEKRRERLIKSRDHKRQNEQIKDNKIVLFIGAVALTVFFCRCSMESAEAEERQEYPQSAYRQEHTQPAYRQEYPQPAYRQEHTQPAYRQEHTQPAYRQEQPQVVYMREQQEIVFNNSESVRRVSRSFEYVQVNQHSDQEKQTMRHRRRQEKQPQSEVKPENKLKIEEITGEESKTKSSYGQKKRKYSKSELIKHMHENLEILNDKESLLNLFKQDKNEDINNLFYYCGSKNVVKKILNLDRRKDKEFILQNEQFQKLLLESKNTLLEKKGALYYLWGHPEALAKVKKYGGEELKRKVVDALYEQIFGEKLE